MKRFHYSTWRKEKLTTKIEFPVNGLDLSSFAGVSKHESVKKGIYNLYGICHHMGSLSGGHYVADVKGDDGKWYHCDDSIVSSLHSPQASSSSVYLLFYVR